MNKLYRTAFAMTLISAVNGMPLASPAQAAAPGQSAPAKPSAAGPSAPGRPATTQVPDTLMFTIDEFNEIQSHLAGTTAEASENNAIENATLYLSTILYAGPNDWTIWVNGAPIGPNDEFQSFKVTSVSPNSVELLVPMSAQGMRPVHLGPNQTFLARSGIVVEGRTQ